jgi:uncharacterized protein (TIGR01319 family)
MSIDSKQIRTILATDCGSTTTKAILFEELPDGWRMTCRGEAPTTVEKPVADVTIGAINAFHEVEDLSRRKLIDHTLVGGDACPLISKQDPNDPNGIDLYISTSSAGGGLQMIVAGVVSSMTTESAERAALGAGAIVMDTVSIDDGRESHERVQKIRHLRPDIVLIAGGTDGGTVDHPLELAETVLQADPRPRFGETIKLPVIYAANCNARDEAQRILENRFSFVAVDNLRPSLEHENLSPARDAIHEIFLNHVMSHAPGYKKLLSWSPIPIMPTPAAFGQMVLEAAKRWNMQVLAVDIGGATTDVFSVFSPSGYGEPVYNRTVSANLGMSYSVANVLAEAGDLMIERWLPFSLKPGELIDRLRNKMIRPTTIPQTFEDLLVEQAVSREALRLAFEHHKRLAVGLSGQQQQRTIGDFFRQESDRSLVNLWDLNLIIGSGGVLSHAPQRAMSALMLLDAYEPLGVTDLAVDSVFMMPHLGVLASIKPEAASEIFIRDCIVHLGSSVSPCGRIKPRNTMLTVDFGDGSKVQLRAGDIETIPLGPNEYREALLIPAHGINVGAGNGKPLQARLKGGTVGVILDGRGRPICLDSSHEARKQQMLRWYDALGITFNA